MFNALNGSEAARCGNRSSLCWQLLTAFCWQLLLLYCRSLKGWLTCWTSWKPGTAPLAAPGTPSWRKWPRLACESSSDTSNSNTRRSAAPTTRPVKHKKHKMSHVSIWVCIPKLKHLCDITWQKINLEACSVFTWVDKNTQIKPVQKYQPFYGFLF